MIVFCYCDRRDLEVIAPSASEIATGHSVQYAQDVMGPNISAGHPSSEFGNATLMQWC